MNKEDLVHFTEVSFGRIKDGRYVSDFFFSFLMWKIQFLIWRDFIILKKMEGGLWIARPSCLVRERRSLQPWWGIHIHSFLLDRKTCKVLCKKVWVGMLWAWDFVDCYVHSCCCVLLFGGAGKENAQKEKSRAIGIGHSGSLDYWLLLSGTML